MSRALYDILPDQQPALPPTSLQAAPVPMQVDQDEESQDRSPVMDDVDMEAAEEGEEGIEEPEEESQDRSAPRATFTSDDAMSEDHPSSAHIPLLQYDGQITELVTSQHLIMELERIKDKKSVGQGRAAGDAANFILRSLEPLIDLLKVELANIVNDSGMEVEFALKSLASGVLGTEFPGSNDPTVPRMFIPFGNAGR
jgi:hypothetical protein